MNPWMYAKDWKKCSRCGLLRPGKQVISDVCVDLLECETFRLHGHGSNPRPKSVTAAQRLAALPEPPPVRAQRAEEEFQYGPHN